MFDIVERSIFPRYCPLVELYKPKSACFLLLMVAEIRMLGIFGELGAARTDHGVRASTTQALNDVDLLRHTILAYATSIFADDNDQLREVRMRWWEEFWLYIYDL